MNLNYSNIFLKSKSVYIFYIFISLLFSAKFISLYYLSFISESEFLFPSHTNSSIDLHSQDITMITSWARRANENLSIFQLSSNIYEIKNSYHYFSSRGLGLFLTTPFLFFFNNNIFEIIIFFFIIYSFTNIFLVSKYFKSKNINQYLLFSLLTVIFGSKLFGGVLNPLHYIEFFKLGFYNNSISSLYRMPNILINNIFIFIYFLLLIKIYNEQFKKSITLVVTGILLFIITFIDPIIFLIFLLTSFVVTTYFYFFKDMMSKKLFSIIIIFFSFISLSLIFHFYNYLFVINDTLRHGTFDANYNQINNFFWTGNLWYSREMFLIPVGMYFFLSDKIKHDNKIEIIFLICGYIFWEISYYLDPIFSSRITNRNFEILLAAIGFVIGYNFLINIKSIFTKNKLLLIFLILLSLIYNFFLTKSFELLFYYAAIMLILSLVIFYRLYKSSYLKIILTVTVIIIFCFQSLNPINLKNIKSSLNKSTELDQKNFFDWVNNSEYKKSKIISLNFGLVLNSEIHTDMFVYFTQITRMPVTMSYDNLVNRINHIFYLYGFSLNDLNVFLENYTTSWEINEDNFTLDKNNIALLNKILFYTKFQSNYNPDIPRKIILDYYKKFLNNKGIITNEFDICVITKLDQKYIKLESYMYMLLEKSIPIFENDFLKAYNCGNLNKI